MARSLRWHVALAAAGLALGVAGPVLGQQRVGSGGRALDANPQVGSGGQNQPEGQVDFRRRNDVVTGNVSGGRAFRGDVGFRAPNEFRGSLGSDDLFEFRRNSLQSSQGTFRGRTNIGRGGGGQSVFRSFSGMPDVGNAPRSTRIVPDRGFYDPGAFSQGQTPLAPREAAEDAERGFAQDYGQPSNYSLSPLLGIRQDSQRSGLIDPFDPDETVEREDGTESPVGEDAGFGVEAYDRQREDEERGRVDMQLRPELSTRMDTRRDGQPEGLLEEAGVSSERLMQDQPGSFLGRQLQAQLMANRQRPQTLDEQVARMERRLFNRLEQRNASPDDRPYQNVLEAMQSRKAEASDDAATDQQRQGNDGEIFTDLPSEEQVAEAERKRREALARFYGDREQTDSEDGEDSATEAFVEGESLEERQARADESESDRRVGGEFQAGEDDEQGEQTRGEWRPDGTTGQEDGEQSGQAEAGADGSLDQTMAKLNYEAAPLESLVGERENRVNRLLETAEEQLAKGEYFSAERTYEQLLIDAPDRPMVRVGLIHAQFGAGLIISAAKNMRQLFNEHPELIATRYEGGLLPPKERLQWLQQELQGMIQQQESVTEAGLMMAYLGYQTGSRQLVRYGLATAESASPRDPLLPMLRRIWLDQKPAKRGGDAGDAKPATGGERGSQGAPAKGNAPAK